MLISLSKHLRGNKQGRRVELSVSMLNDPTDGSQEASEFEFRVICKVKVFQICWLTGSDGIHCYAFCENSVNNIISLIKQIPLLLIDIAQYSQYFCNIMQNLGLRSSRATITDRVDQSSNSHSIRPQTLK